jgi:molybdenum-dependent DNA-binding transcriptional regulator ModE
MIAVEAAWRQRRLYPLTITQLSIRIDLETGGQIGPGKIALLEAISKTGSIAAAAQSMNMSRMTAWLLVEEINTLLSKPAVTTEWGGCWWWRKRDTDAGWTKAHPTLPLYRNAHTSRRAPRDTGFS